MASRKQKAAGPDVLTARSASYVLDLDDPQTPGALDYLASSLDRVGRFDDAEKARVAANDARLEQAANPAAEPESEASKVERDAVEG